jgi:hypothetical protein
MGRDAKKKTRAVFFAELPGRRNLAKNGGSTDMVQLKKMKK